MIQLDIIASLFPPSFSIPHFENTTKVGGNRRQRESGWRLAHGLCHWVCPPSDGHAQWDEPLDGLTPSFNFTPRTIHKYPKTQHTLGSFEILKTKKKIRSGRLSLFCRRPQPCRLSLSTRVRDQDPNTSICHTTATTRPWPSQSPKSPRPQRQPNRRRGGSPRRG